MRQAISSRVPRPDEGWAWVVAFACFTINFITAGLARTAGVLYVALIDMYGISREAATTPFSIRVCVRNSVGPVVGLLGQRYGIRPIASTGGIFAAVGGMLCFVAPDVFWITIFWGVIHGIGFGLATVLHMIVINQYFDKYRATALGIGFSGDCFGSFAFPDIIGTLLHHYDVRGTFLILGAIVLNIIPAALLLRPPPWLENEKDVKQVPEYENKAFDHSEPILNVPSECRMEVCKLGRIEEVSTEHQQLEVEITCDDHAKNETETNNRRNSLLSSISGVLNFLGQHSDCPSDGQRIRKNSWMQSSELLPHCVPEGVISLRNSSEFIHRSGSITSAGTKLANGDYSDDNELRERARPRSVSNSESKFVKSAYVTRQNSLPDGQQVGTNEKTLNCLLDLSVEDTVRKGYKSEMQSNQMILNAKELEEHEETQKVQEKGSENTEDAPKQQSLASLFFRTNIKPIYLLICASMGAYAFLFIAVLTVIIDFVADRGLSSVLGKYLLIGFSVADLFGRLSFGQIIDRKLLSMKTYAMMTLSLMGLFVSVIPLYCSFVYLMTCMACYGFLQGGSAIMFPILISQYMEKREESIAMGCLTFYAGLLMLPMAPMIGYFRDTIGSYNGMFYIVGIGCIFVGLLWQLEPLIVKNEGKPKKTRCSWK